MDFLDHIWYIVIEVNVMLSIYTVSFFGHRILRNPMQAEKHIETLVRKLICEKEYVEFLVGRDGDFDLLVASCVMRVKKDLFEANSSLIWVQPYPLSSYLNNPQDFEKFYDEVEFFDSNNSVQPKSAFKKRNEALLKRSDLAIFWVENNYGGAYSSLQYAKAHNIKNINLAEIET